MLLSSRGVANIERMIEILSDATKVSEHIKQVSEAETALRAEYARRKEELESQTATLKLREVAVQKAETAAATNAADLASKLRNHAEVQERFQSNRATVESRLAAKEQALKAKEAELIAAQKSFNENIERETATMVQNQSNLRTFEAALKAKEADLIEREAEATRLKAEYTTRLSKLREVIA